MSTTLEASPIIKVSEEAADDHEQIKALEPVNLFTLIQSDLKLDTPLIQGVARQGEVIQINADTKSGKTFLVGNLAIACAAGQAWLGHDVTPGKVLIVDNELKPSQIKFRMNLIANEMRLGNNASDDALRQIDVFALRGKKIDIVGLAVYLSGIPKAKYRLIIIDALYKLLPKGCDENKNADMTHFYDELICYAESLQSLIVVVHHMSKGNQADKKITDLGSGAGAAIRSVDTTITIREHDQPGLGVMEYKCRSFADPPAQTVKFDFPLWHAVTVEPVLKQRSAGDAKQKADDDEADRVLLQVLDAEPQGLSEIRARTGFGDTRITRGCRRLVEAGKVKWERSQKNGKGKKADRWSLISEVITDEKARDNSA